MRVSARKALFHALTLATLAAWGCSSSSDDGIQQPVGPAGPSAPSVTGQGVKPTNPAHDKIEYASDSVIVKWKQKPTASLASLTASKVQGFVLDKNSDGVDDRFNQIADGKLALIQLQKGASVEKTIEALRKDPNVAYVEPNFTYYISAIPNDARFGELYGLNNTGQGGGVADADIDAVEAWDDATGSHDIVVGVVDTGVDYTHPDLAANIWTNPLEIPGNNVDDDGNGVIDDVHGFNAITGGGNPMDDNNHGTHCSGTIGGVGNNGIGVAGVNHQVSIMGLKFLSAGGSGSTEDAIEAINYAVAQKRAGVNIRVLSNSWGGGGFSQALQDAIQAANDVDILFVAAAGNSGQDNDSVPNYPSNYDVPNVVAVAATDNRDALAGFSSYGLTTVDIGAPGVAILSTIPGGGYASFDGTSMATPHVAGVAALVLSANNTLSTAELKDAIITSGDPIPALSGRTVSGARLNAASALEAAGPPVPRFNLAIGPPATTITQGESATVSVDVGSVAGFTGDVALSVTTSPALDAAIDVSPAVVSAPGSATVTIQTSEATAPGVYVITVTGTSGDLVRSRTVSLRVRRAGTIDIPFPSTDTPIAIPDSPGPAITSVINVPQPITVDEVNVDVNITHTYIGDLVVALTSPSGTRVVLHNRAGGGTDNLNTTFVLPTEFTNENALGNWTLEVQDLAGIDVGTLDSWTLHIIGIPSGEAGFLLSASPASATVTQGESATYGIDVGSFGGFNGAVALSVASSPAFAGGLSISPTSVTAPGTATLTATTDCGTAPGTYALTITGTSGAQTLTTTVSLTVSPAGLATVTYPSTDTPIAIPDSPQPGITSTLNIDAPTVLTGLQVQVDITHTYIGDLLVSLTGPNGTSVVLHNRTGGGTDNLHETYDVPDFVGQAVTGAWVLSVVDQAGADVGTLDSWAVIATGASNSPPTASFTYTVAGRTVAFQGSGADTGCGGGIAGYSWDFGDGTSSTEQNPTHTYATSGAYNVTLTVTDTGGATASVTQTVTITRETPVISIESVTRSRDNFEFNVELLWRGAEGRLVELYRNRVLTDIPDNDGHLVDTFRRYETTYSWRICERNVIPGFLCTNTVTITFGPNFDEVTASVVENGVQSVRVIKIRDAE